MPLSIETLRELAKLTELKTKGGIPEPHFELLKTHIKERGTLTREAWEVFGLAWNLKVDGVLTEDEYAEQVDEGVASILKTGATVSPGVDARPQPVSARSPAAGIKKTKKAGGGGGEATTKKKRGAKDGSNAKAASAGPVKRIRKTSPSKVPCSMCPSTFSNRQGLGMHMKATHGDDQEGTQPKKMLGNNGGGGAVLPWDTAGPGRCWTVEFNHPTPGSDCSTAPNSAAKFVLKSKDALKLDWENEVLTPDKTKLTRGASSRKRYTFRQKANVISNLRMLEGVSKEIWASDKLTPQQLLEAQTKIHHSLISKWAKDEENIVLRAGQEGAAALLEEVRGMETSDS